MKKLQKKLSQKKTSEIRKKVILADGKKSPVTGSHKEQFEQLLDDAVPSLVKKK